METLTIHKTLLPKKKSGEPGGAELHVFDGIKTQKLSGPKLDRWLAKLKPHQIRSTFAGCDIILLALKDRGCPIFYAPWMKSGLAKGAKTEEILSAFHALDQGCFYGFVPRADLFDLRRAVDTREMVIDNRKRSFQVVEALERSLGANPIIEAAKASQDKERLAFEGLAEKEVAKRAEAISECRLFNAIAAIGDAWNSAAKIMAYSGGLDRFWCLAAFWKFCGLDVRDGAMPRRKRGETGGWNPRLRTACWQLGESIYKNRENPWRQVYERYRAEEYAAHPTKCGCKQRDGHSTNRAKRKMVKEILKKFFLAARQKLFAAQEIDARRQETKIAEDQGPVDSPTCSVLRKKGSRQGQSRNELLGSLALPRAKEKEVRL